MEFPGDCLTNVLKLDGLTSVPYQVYSFSKPHHQAEKTASRDDQAIADPEATTQLPQTRGWREQEAFLRKVVFLCRDEGAFVAHDGERIEMWLFEGGRHSKPTSEIATANMSKVVADSGWSDGEGMSKTHAGTFCSSSLEKASSLSSSKAGAPTSAPATSASFDQTLRASKLLHITAAQANRPLSAHTTSSMAENAPPTSPDEREDPATTYGHFMTAVISSLSYSLAKVHHYVPLNFRTLINPEPSFTSDLGVYGRKRKPDVSQLVRLTTLNAHLTTSGTLLISPVASDRSGLSKIGSLPSSSPGDASGFDSVEFAGADLLSPQSSLEENQEQMEQNAEQVRDESTKNRLSDLWLAPGGKIARFVEPEDQSPSYRIDDKPPLSGSSGNFERERARSRLVERRYMDLWKSDVIAWLAQHGISLEAPVQWVDVSVYMGSTGVFPDPDEQGQERSSSMLTDILWPVALCFKRAELDFSGTEKEEIGWFVPSKDHSRDPIAFAERWYLGKKERADGLMRAQRALDAEETATRRKKSVVEVNLPNEASSAQHGSSARLINPSDVPAASAVYPTPPDGVVPHGASVIPLSEATGTTPSIQPSSNIPQGSSNEAVDCTSDDDNLDIDMDLWTGEPDEGADGRRKASGASAFDLPSAGLDDGDGGNMFGEMDEEMFNETGVTEADFSFFDQPGDDDMFGADVDTAKCTDGVAQMEEVAQSLRDAGQKLEDGATSTEVVIPKSEFARDDLRQEETQSRSGEDGDPEGVSVKRERSPTNSVALSRPSTLREPHGGVLVISPPFSPEQVLKRILPAAPSTARDEQPADSSEGRPAVKQTGEWTQTSGNFEPVVFNTTLDVATHKYDSGHFWFSGPQNVSSIPAQSSNLAVIPRIGLPKESREPRRHLPHEAGKGLDDEHAAVFPKARSGRSGSETDEEGREGESSDQADDTSDTSDEETAPVGASHGMKRKRAIEDDGDAMASSMKLLAVHQSADAPLAQTEAGPSLEELGPDPADWSMASLFEPRRPTSQSLMELGGKEYVDTAQIVADQIISGSLDPLRRPRNSQTTPYQLPILGMTIHDQRIAQRAVQEAFPRATQCNLEAYASIQDIMPETTFSAAPAFTRPNIYVKRSHSQHNSISEQTSSATSNIVELPPPHVLVRRGDSTMEVLPVALNFWETLGLGPFGGSKDVIAFCIHPPGDGVKGAAAWFLERMGSTYNGCRLGNHVSGEVKDYVGGLVPVDIHSPDPGGATVQEIMTAIRRTCMGLGNLLPTLPDLLQNVVIYIIDPFSHSGGLVDLCMAFGALFHTYVQSPKIQQSKKVNEIVLQIVPIDFIAAKDAVVVPTQAQYTRLALEVYERCALTQGQTIDTFPSSRCASAILLTQPVPKSIDFRLTPEASSSLLHENRCIHVAYSCGNDDRWISAAWTGNRGELQASSSFCLRRSSSGNMAFADIAREIWETTIDMIQFKRVHWRVMVVKAGVMGVDEIEAWTSIAAQPTQPPTALILLSADATGSLALRGTAPALPDALDLDAAAAATDMTPVSTPAPNTQSPEQSATPAHNAATPANAPTPTPAANPGTPGTTADATAASENDAEAILVDPTDDTWMVTLSHRLHNSPDTTDYRPSLASGYLVKRAGAHDDMPPAVLGVKILHALPPASPAQGLQRGPFDPLLREILGAYRDLSSLAWLKGVVLSDAGHRSGVGEVVPWHVAAAIKAQEALSYLM